LRPEQSPAPDRPRDKPFARNRGTVLNVSQGGTNDCPIEQGRREPKAAEEFSNWPKRPLPFYGGLPPRFIELKSKSTTHQGLPVALCFERRAPTPVGQGWGEAWGVLARNFLNLTIRVGKNRRREADRGRLVWDELGSFRNGVGG
jgi:hypothetical protein